MHRVLLLCILASKSICAGACPDNWLVYNGVKLNFSICHPKSVVIHTRVIKMQSSYLLGHNWSVLDYSNNAKERRLLLEMVVPEKLTMLGNSVLQPYTFKAVVRVGVSKNIHDINQCQYQKINDVAMGHFMQGGSYRYVTDANQCLAVEWIITGDINLSGGRPALSSLEVLRRHQASLLAKKIALTFKYLGYYRH